jgi:hypothetical protein
MRPIDYSLTFNIIGDQKDRNWYRCVIDAGRLAIPLIWVNWCAGNLSKQCAWWFDKTTAYMGFEDEKEGLWFCLTCMEPSDG